MRRVLLCALAALLMLCGTSASAETDGDCIYTLVDAQGNILTQRAGAMYVDDEYIASDNRHYRVVSVDNAAQTAQAEYLGMATIDLEAQSAFSALAAAKSDAAGDRKKLICMYSTHSDESYIPDDGTESKWNNAGIYDVGDSLKAALEDKGIETVYSHETFLPHDADAYTRSRRTAEALLKKGPDALIDIHRDAIPASQYETEVDGEDISKVRLFVGRSNPNAAANKAFAQEIKATADKEYPGLIKDIFIGRGNYNQELYGNSILLEFGTHTIDKDKAIGSTTYMADVLNNVLYGKGAKGAKKRTASAKSVASGIGWAVLVLAIAGIVYAVVSTGSGRAAIQKLKRHASEVTGGLIGQRKEDHEDQP